MDVSPEMKAKLEEWLKESLDTPKKVESALRAYEKTMISYNEHIVEAAYYGRGYM